MNSSMASRCSGVTSDLRKAMTSMPSFQRCDTLSTPWPTSRVEPNRARDTPTVTMAAMERVMLRRRLLVVSRRT
jgi:hypothetical protein